MQGEDVVLSVAADELDRHGQVEQRADGRLGHWPRDDIPSHDDPIDTLTADIREDRLECGKIPVNVVDRRQPHHTTLFGFAS
jgi:hypothetical protein